MQDAEPARDLWQQWRQGDRPDVHDFLARRDTLTLLELVAVLRVDQRERWQIGERVPAESYLERYPDLETDVEHAVELIYAEFLVREGQGEAPRLDEYVARFPACADRLRIQIELHRSLESEASTDRTNPVSLRSGPNDPSTCAALARPGSGFKWPTPAGYDILRLIGHGGMGVVYQARDRQRGEIVALKTLKHIDETTVYRFKQEFRALADLRHPNLVNLYELRADEDEWFFTMEFIEGTDIATYVRGQMEAPSAETVAVVPPGVGMALDPSSDPEARPGRPAAWSAARYDCLLGVLHQLASGLAALHEGGQMHRDLKPANVLVTPQGRVVLLDFGLAAPLDRQGRHQSAEPGILGTIAYMAPEQAAAAPVSAAADWYSFGVMMYELLTGQVPFHGSAWQVLQKKQRSDPPAPSFLAEEIPEAFDVLCMDLLERSPEARPTGREVLARLAGAGPGAFARNLPAAALLPANRRLPLVGRKPHLETLADAYQTLCRGRPLTLFVHGRSGIGKTSLVESFLDSLRRREPAVILCGRCYESESIPFKAVDSLMDSLSQHLAQQMAGDVATVLPRDAAALARVFPVFQRVEALASTPGWTDAADERELRRRAFGELRELLIRLGDRQPLVLFIDDLQWGDSDSAALFAEVFRPPDPPVLLLIGAYRSEQAQTSPFLQPLLGNPASLPEQRELAIGPLTEAEARELALKRITTDPIDGDDETVMEARAQAIARESAGNPMFVYELAEHRQVTASPADVVPAVSSVRLDDVLWARVQRLSEASRRLMEVVAVAGKPLPLALAVQAAELDAIAPESTLGAWRMLCSGRLIGSARRGGQDVIEPYHDRVRETVAAHLAPAVLREHHRRLAHTLEAVGQAEPETLARHFHGAAEPAQAARYYALGGDAAAQALAFEHASRLYGLALELGAWPGTEAAALHAKRADALANAGRGPESAAAYLRAADGAERARAMELQRLAAYQYCASGHAAEGRGVFEGVVGSIGMSMPRTVWQAILWWQWYRFRLWVQGLSYQERDATQIPERDLHRIDVTWAITAGLSMIEPVTAHPFQARNLLLSLRAGEPHRLARAMAWEVAVVTMSGKSGGPRAARLRATAIALAQRLDDPYALGLVHLASGMSEVCVGRWSSVCHPLRQAIAIFQDRCRGVSWERGTAELFLMRTLLMMGEFAEAARLSVPLLKDARERGDVYSAIMNGAYIGANVHLAADDVTAARGLVRELVGEWPSREFDIQQLHALWGETCIDLYSGEGAAAWDRLNRVWPMSRGPQMVQIIRVWMLSFRCRSALAAARQASARDRITLLNAAEADARRLERAGMDFAAALAQLARAGVASSRGDQAAARERLTRAIEGLDAVDMHSYAAAARWRLGVSLGGLEGQTLVDQADSWMRSQAIRNPVRMVAMHAPGFGS